MFKESFSGLNKQSVNYYLKRNDLCVKYFWPSLNWSKSQINTRGSVDGNSSTNGASSNNYQEMFNRKFQASSNKVLHMKNHSLSQRSEIKEPFTLW